MRTATEVELALLALMADTRDRRWWDYAALQEALPDYTRNQIISGLSELRRRQLVTPGRHLTRAGQEFTITTAGELVTRAGQEAAR